MDSKSSFLFMCDFFLKLPRRSLACVSRLRLTTVAPKACDCLLLTLALCFFVIEAFRRGFRLGDTLGDFCSTAFKSNDKYPRDISPCNSKSGCTSFVDKVVGESLADMAPSFFEGELLSTEKERKRGPSGNGEIIPLAKSPGN